MLRKANLFLFIFTFCYFTLNAQCKTWIGSSNKDDAENAHSIYRAAMKTNDFKIAFENWKKAYDFAPAADGKRDFHYTDGIKLYKQMYKNEADAAKKEEYALRIMELYDEAIACYEAKGIELRCDNDDCYKNKISYLLGRKAYDMYYELNQPYPETMATLEKAIEVGGNNIEYIVINPLANIVVYQYLKEQLNDEKAREVHKVLNELAEFNIANNERYSQYFTDAINAANAEYGKIETKIFDCEFFIKKLKPQYDADPENIELNKDLYNELRQRGCEDSHPLMAKMKAKYEAWAEIENAKRQAEFEANNPSIVAKQLYDEGDFEGAVTKYEEAIAKEEDPEKLAGYYFSMASILYRKLNKHSDARKAARKSAELRPEWGRPFMLIGDMYGSTARSCGDSWNQRLAILAAMEKYSYAKSIDLEVSEEASDRLGKYRASMPAQDEGFMRGIKEGQRVNVGCWIGETVSVRYR